MIKELSCLPLNLSIFALHILKLYNWIHIIYDSFPVETSILSLWGIFSILVSMFSFEIYLFDTDNATPAYFCLLFEWHLQGWGKFRCTVVST